MTRLDAIRARLSAATPGPWTATEDGSLIEDPDADVFCLYAQYPVQLGGTTKWYPAEKQRENAALIAAAPADLAALLAVAEAALRLHVELRTSRTFAEAAEEPCWNGSSDRDIDALGDALAALEGEEAP